MASSAAHRALPLDEEERAARSHEAEVLFASVIIWSFPAPAPSLLAGRDAFLRRDAFVRGSPRAFECCFVLVV